MKIQFKKYQGTGNDFVMIDNRKNDISLTQKQVAFLCHRRFGIGADGLILLEELEGYDFKMVYYNSDGRESSMCGNGGRCILQFAHDLGLIREEYKFLAIDGDHLGRVNADEVSLKMMDATKAETAAEDFILDTGSPHYVRPKTNIDAQDLITEAKGVRYSDRFKAEGINFNYLEVLSDDQLAVRTYERGVEDETYSCGTGVTAATLVHAQRHHLPKGEFGVKTKGGNLKVRFEATDKGFENIWLSGPATYVFDGEINL